MKVAFFLGSFPALSETFILSQITGLINRKVDIGIFARHRGADSVTHPDVEKFDVLKRTYYYGGDHQNMPKSKVVRVLKAFYILAKNLRNDPYPFIRSLNIKKYGIHAWDLSLFYTVEKLREYNLDQYDVIHCHFGYNGQHVLTLSNLGLIKGKIITTFYGWDCSTYLKINGEDVYRELFEQNALILCLSEEMKERLVKIGCPPEKIKIHHLGVDVERFRADRKKIHSNGTCKLLTVGRMVEKKGVEYAIRAVSKLTEKYPGIHYTIIGDGPLRKDLEQLSTDLGVADHVHFLGAKNQTDIIDAMNRSDIFLAPSVTAENGDMEGTPTVLMEAQAMEMLVLSTFHSGIPEVVLDGRSGYLVPERDSDEIANKLALLIERPDMWNDLRQEGRKHIEEQYNEAILSQKLEEVYRNL
jgi:colanic acid/amylovoran biosynthesis glycosyltransferase